MKPDLPYRNRSEAGRLLAEALSNYKTNPSVVVLGLTRGGVPVAAEVAGALGVSLDVVVVRKLGVPSQPELAMGAVSGGGVKVVDQEVVRWSACATRKLKRSRRGSAPRWCGGRSCIAVTSLRST